MARPALAWLIIATFCLLWLGHTRSAQAQEPCAGFAMFGPDTEFYITFEYSYEYGIVNATGENSTCPDDVQTWTLKPYLLWWEATATYVESNIFSPCACNLWNGDIEAVVDDCQGNPWPWDMNTTAVVTYCAPVAEIDPDWTLAAADAPFPSNTDFSQYEVVNNCQIAQWEDVPFQYGYIDGFVCPPGLGPPPEGKKYCIRNEKCRITVIPSSFVSCADLTATSYFEMISFNPQTNTEQEFVTKACCFMKLKAASCGDLAVGEWIVELLELYSDYFEGKTVGIDTILEWLECSIGTDEVELDEDPTQATNAPIGDGNAGGCDDLMESGNPVHVAFGHKHESETDASIPLIGGAMSITREYTSQSNYNGANLVGKNWSGSPFWFIFEVPDGQSTVPWCGGPPPAWVQVEYAHDNGRYYPAGATNLFMESTTLTIDSVTYPVWRQVDPGQWEVDYLRTGTNVDAHEVGLMRQRRDMYGNSWTYNYTDFGSSPAVARLTSIDCRNASNPTHPDAQVRFIWNTSSQYGLAGTLAAIQGVRFDGSGDAHQTHLIEYTYEANGDPDQVVSDEVGTAGDLIQVTVRERTDSVDGNGAPLDRIRITQYRYHDSEITSRSNSDGRLTVLGEDHQLKLVIRPEQIEVFAEQFGFSDVETAAAALLEMDDGDELGTSGSPKVIDLAAKIIAYQASGNKVSRQYVQTGCGCSGGTGESQRFDYSYIDSPTSMDTTELREYVGGSTDVYRYHYYDWQMVGAGTTLTPYLVQYALIEPDENGDPAGRMWVTGYEYNSLRELKFIATPSAMASYTPGSGSAQASYAKSTSSGLVKGYEYADHRVKSMRVRKGYDSDIANYTRIWERDFDATRPWLVTELRRFTTESASPTDDEIEVTGFAYGFHSSTDGVKWTKTTVEAELPAENGPAGTDVVYETAELFDALGNNTWSLAADGALTKRVYDASGAYQTAGMPLSIIQNSDTSGLPGTGEKPEDLDWDGRNTEGGSLTTTLTYDLLGRRASTTRPGNVSSYSRRERRAFAGRSGLDDYYAIVTLPSKSGTAVNGTAVITWYNAGDNMIGTSEYLLTDIGNYNPTNGAYTLGSQVARSEVSHSLSGLVEERREWWDLGQSPYVTSYEYDGLGRLATTTDPIGTITENAAYDVLDRVLKVKVGQSGGTNVTVAEYFYDHGGTPGSPTQGVGNGNLTYVRQHVDDSSVRDTVRDFDFRDRPYRTLNESAPHEYVLYDNLDRAIERFVFNGTPTSTDPPPLANRGLDVKTHYSQRGLVYRQSIATDPTSGSPEFLQTNSWFDPNGRAVVQWSPNSPITKRELDGLGRTTMSYVVRDSELYDNGPGRDGTPPIDDDGSLAPSLSYDTVLEQTEYEYTSSDRAEFVTTLRRVHDDVSTAGPLTYNGSGGTGLGVPSYVGFYYDSFNRRIRSVNIGTNDTTTDRYKAGIAAPSWPPGEVPEWDDVDFEDYLVSATEYDDRGRPYLTTDPEGKQTKMFFDAMNRRIAVAENFVDVAITSWSAVNGRWTFTGVGGSSGQTDEDRLTSFVYDGAGNITKQVAHIPGGDLQETQYLYAAAPANLLSEVRYPNESTGVAGTDREYKVLYAYNRLGELTSAEDQNETLHEYDRDDLGRVTFDDVTIELSSIDDWVRSIGVEYDDFGRLERVTSYTTPEHTTVKNQAEFAYTSLWQIKEVYQDYDGEVEESSGVPTGNTVRVRYAYATADYDSGNYSRLSKITYPEGTEYEQHYGSPGSDPPDVNDQISRLTHMRVGNQGPNTVKYQHVGLGMVAEVDYPVIDVQLDRTASHDGKRNNQGFTSQTSGIYPGWDRFGRVKKHAWVDGAYTTGTGSNPSIPPLVEIDYTYDRSSNRLTRTDARPGASWSDRDFRYEYDGLDRLVQADRGAEGGSWSSAVGGQKWALDMLGNWDSIYNDTNGDGSYTSSSPDEEIERTHNFANEIEDIGILPFAYDAAGNMTEQGLPATTTKYYTHDAWNRLTSVSIDAAALGEYEYNALHWRTVKRSRTPGSGSLDEMRLMYYSANWQLLEERIDRSWTSGFTEDERAQTFWGKRYIDDAVARRRDRDNNGTYDNNFFYVTDAQFSTVAMVSASNARIVERTTYDAYGKARHHFGGDVTGDGAATQAADDAALVATINAGSNSIGQSNYKAEQDLNRDGTISLADRQTLAALTGNADQAALASGLVSFTTTGSGGSTVHGPDSPIAWDGYVFNAETGQYHVRFRWYDAVLGRWLERDLLGTRPITCAALIASDVRVFISTDSPLGLLALGAEETNLPLQYEDSMSIYEYAGTNSVSINDPFGRDWYVPDWAIDAFLWCTGGSGYTYADCLGDCINHWDSWFDELTAAILLANAVPANVTDDPLNILPVRGKGPGQLGAAGGGVADNTTNWQQLWKKLPPKFKTQKLLTFLKAFGKVNIVITLADGAVMASIEAHCAGHCAGWTSGERYNPSYDDWF